jgi:hypothetical protein
VSARVSGISAVRAVRTTHEIVDDADGLTARFDAQAILSRLDWDGLFSSSVAGEARVTEGSVAHDALVQALTSSTLPTLSWARPD